MTDFTPLPRLVASVLCEDLLLDQLGRPTLYGVFRLTTAAAYPASRGRFYVYNELTAPEGSEYTHTVRFIAPDGDF
ncbi:MAG: hypothetical protein KKB13_24585, partial [Chloroflexi bacterium]|nr:hypothetical protein [Chloroflexota bacterium]